MNDVSNIIDVINIKDMLDRNINRMCATNDIKVLNDMYKSALNKIDNIYVMNDVRLRKDLQNER